MPRTQHYFHLIIFVKRSHKASPNSRDRDMAGHLDARNDMHLQGMEELLIAILQTVFYQSSILGIHMSSDQSHNIYSKDTDFRDLWPQKGRGFKGLVISWPSSHNRKRSKNCRVIYMALSVFWNLLFHYKLLICVPNSLLYHHKSQN